MYNEFYKWNSFIERLVERNSKIINSLKCVKCVMNIINEIVYKVDKIVL